MSMTPSEISVIAGDIAIKSSKVEMGFIDRFSGTLIFTGRISNVQTAITAIVTYLKNHLGFTICEITRNMKKIILMGRSECGKTTLTQALKGDVIHYHKNPVHQPL